MSDLYRINRAQCQMHVWMISAAITKMSINDCTGQGGSWIVYFYLCWLFFLWVSRSRSLSVSVTESCENAHGVIKRWDEVRRTSLQFVSALPQCNCLNATWGIWGRRGGLCVKIGSDMRVCNLHRWVNFLCPVPAVRTLAGSVPLSVAYFCAGGRKNQ